MTMEMNLVPFFSPSYGKILLYPVHERLETISPLTCMTVDLVQVFTMLAVYSRPPYSWP